MLGRKNKSKDTQSRQNTQQNTPQNNQQKRHFGSGHRSQPHHSSHTNDTVRVIALGGMEEVGKNMMIFELGEDIILVDMGLQFPEEDMHGIDYVIPDISYLKDKIDRIRGVFITHGHYDHIGAIHHLMQQLSPRIPMYSLKLTIAMIKKRAEEFGINLNLNTVNPEEKIKLGRFEVEFFRVNHTIPDSAGIAIYTPQGIIIHTGDWKMDHHPVNDEPIELHKIAKYGYQGVLAAFCDSTNAYKPGFQISEKDIMNTLDGIFVNAKGRIVVATFASLLTRIQQVITLSEKFGRKVVIAGRSMENNVQIASELGYMKINKGTIISAKHAQSLPDQRVTIIGTGAQGERNAMLMRLAMGETKDLELKDGDTVLFSSSVIPGNESTVQMLVDLLYRKGATVINYKMMDVHAGGHAKAEETKIMVKLLRPKYFIPIEGNHTLLVTHSQVIESIGIKRENIFIMDDGSVLEFNNRTGQMLDEKLPLKMVAVDGRGVGDVSVNLLDERRQMADAGTLIVLFEIQKNPAKLIEEPNVFSRGFIYMRDSSELIHDLKRMSENLANENMELAIKDMKEFKNLIARKLKKHITKAIDREPLIIPIIQYR